MSHRSLTWPSVKQLQVEVALLLAKPMSSDPSSKSPAPWQGAQGIRGKDDRSPKGTMGPTSHLVIGNVIVS